MNLPIPVGRQWERILGVGVLLVSAFCFAILPVFGKVAYAEGVSPLGLLAWRFGIAAGVLWVVVLVRLRGLPGLDWRLLAQLLVLGGVLLAGEVALYFFGLQYLSAGMAEVLLYLYPAWVVVLTALARRTWPGALIVACTGLAVAGAALTVLGGGVAFRGDARTGVLLLVAASMAFACYIVLSSRAVRSVGPLVATTVVLTGAALAFAGSALATSAAMPETSVAYAATLGISLVSTVLAFGLLSAGLSRLPATHASVISTSEPVMAVALGAVLLGESVAPGQLIGVTLVVASIVVIVARDVSDSPTHELTDDSL